MRQPVAAILPIHVTKWVDEAYADQSNTSKFAAYRSVQRAFNWARKQGMIASSPVEKIDKPTPNRRETYLTPAQYVQVLAKVKANERGEGPFHDVLVTLWETGCRPSEIRTVEGKHFHADRGVLIFERVLSKGKKRRRVVYLSDIAKEIIARRAAEFPTGPIFRNSKGRPWTKHSLNNRFTHLQGKKKGQRQKKATEPIGFPCTAYMLRHGFATDRLKSGVDSTTVATLLGHTTTRMLETVYQHVEQDDDHMRTALKSRRTSA